MTPAPPALTLSDTSGGTETQRTPPSSENQKPEAVSTPGDQSQPTSTQPTRTQPADTQGLKTADPVPADTAPVQTQPAQSTPEEKPAPVENPSSPTEYTSNDPLGGSLPGDPAGVTGDSLPGGSSRRLLADLGLRNSTWMHHMVQQLVLSFHVLPKVWQLMEHSQIHRRISPPPLPTSPTTLFCSRCCSTCG